MLREIIDDIKTNGKIDISRYGIFYKNLNRREKGYIPKSNSLKGIKVFNKENEEILLIHFYLALDNQISIQEAEELLGEYRTGYNWRDCYTQITFNGIQNAFIESIYFEKINEIIVDKEKGQYIEDDHSGNITTHDYSELCFDGFVIQYR